MLPDTIKKALMPLKDTPNSTKDRFVLLCAAFKQPMCKVDEKLTVIEG